MSSAHSSNSIIKRNVASRDLNSNPKILRTMGYLLGKKVGEGTYSRVCLACLDIGGGVERRMACKIIDKRTAGGEFIAKFLPREIKILRVIRHPNIVEVTSVIELNDVIYIFMDFCKLGDLLEYIRVRGPLRESKARSYFRQLGSAVQYLHRHNLAHRDLKCENVLLASANTVKLGDFGFSRSCINEDTGKKIMSSTFCGSAAYAAPEILQGISYDPKMYDVWSLGVILYIMLSASMPFDDSNIKSMLRAQLKKSISFTYWGKSTAGLNDLLRSLLEPQVTKRLTIDEVMRCKWLEESNKRLIVSAPR